MNLRTIASYLGPALLVAVVALSIAKVLLTKRSEADTSQTTIRIAHWQLESGLRDALEAVIQEYELLHPDVRIEQVPIPERMGKNWTRTQLVGETAPTIIQLGSVMGITDEILARYFLAISDVVEEPNPYNAGTSLEGIPWRDTFIDTLTNAPAYSETLLDYYGIAGTMFTIRIYYNRGLMQRITGSDTPPATYEEFLALCERVMEFNVEEESAGQPGGILPIAGSKYNAPLMLNNLYSAITQQFALGLSKNLAMAPDAGITAYLDGEWDWNTPAIVKGLETMREVGQYMQPGFLQLGRDDAMFYFAQGRALMISTGSFDATSIRVQSPFDVGVFSFPVPSAEVPEFEDFVMGPFSEGSTGTGFVLGIVRDAPHVEIAMDFLQFLSSKRGIEILSTTSGWLPGVIDVDLPENIKPFKPRMTGYPKGFDLAFGGFPDSQRVYENNFHRLVAPTGSVDEFTRAVERDFMQTAISDARARARSAQRNVALRDSVLAGSDFLGANDESGEFKARSSEIAEGQNQNEAGRAVSVYLADKAEARTN